MSGTVPVPADVLRQLVAVASHVSLGRSAAFAQGRPYPDATARMALGALVDAGLLTVADPMPCGNRALLLDGRGYHVCVKAAGHDPADPWHRAADGAQWTMTEDAQWAMTEQEEQR